MRMDHPMSMEIDDRRLTLTHHGRRRRPQPVLPSELPVLPLRQTVAFLTLAPLRSTARCPSSINRAPLPNRMKLLLLQETDAEEPQPVDVRRVGTVGIICQMAKTPSGQRPG